MLICNVCRESNNYCHFFFYDFSDCNGSKKYCGEVKYQFIFYAELSFITPSDTYAKCPRQNFWREFKKMYSKDSFKFY